MSPHSCSETTTETVYNPSVYLWISDRVMYEGAALMAVLLFTSQSVSISSVHIKIEQGKKKRKKKHPVRVGMTRLTKASPHSPVAA
jgi:hypothetical protein